MFAFGFVKTILISLFKKPATLMYPFKQRMVYKNTRGSIVIDLPNCIYCGICAKRCPADSIVVDRPTKKWEIEPSRCVACLNCVDLCPKKCLSNKNTYSPSVTKKVSELHQGA